MPVHVHIPTALRPECGGVHQLYVEAVTIREALDRLKADQPRLYRAVCDETDSVRRHVNLFIGDAMVNKQSGLHTPLADGDELTIMPAVSGG